MPLAPASHGTPKHGARAALTPLLSQRSVLPLALVLAALATLLVVGYTSLETGRQAVLRDQEASMAELCESLAHSVERLWLEPHAAALERLAASPVLRRRISGSAGQDELFAEWAAAMNVLPDVYFIYYGLEDGSIEHYPPLDLPPGFDPRLRPWYAEGKASVSAAWTNPYAEIITGESVSSAVRALANDAGAVVGVFSMDVTLSGIQDILRRLSLPFGGACYLMQANGALLASSDAEASQLSRIVQLCVQQPQADASHVHEGVYVTISGALSNGWRLALAAPQRSLGASLDPIRSLVSLSLIAFAACSVAAIVVMGVLTEKRTARLSAYFSAMADPSAPLRTLFTGSDEYAALNARFNDAVSRARASEADRLEKERVYRRLFENAPIGFFITGVDGCISYFNQRLGKLLDYTPEQASALKNVSRIYANPADRARMLSVLKATGTVTDFHVRLKTRLGHVVWTSMNAVPIDLPEGGKGLAGFITDISGLVSERDRQAVLAATDPLTGLANRRSLESALAACGRSATGSCALILLDLDGFKELNDTLGHEAGDAALRTFADLVKGVLRKNDLLVRYGGDEFVVLLPEAGPKQARDAAARISEALSGARVRGYDAPMPGVSSGVVTWKAGQRLPEDVLKLADKRLYTTKRSRKKDSP
ncbi:MAG: diguanylate cyclase [Spirochaetia bacterium]|nr:diguanylate cyclase [Spirochaetia bacterium]